MLDRLKGKVRGFLPMLLLSALSWQGVKAQDIQSVRKGFAASETDNTKSYLRDLTFSQLRQNHEIPDSMEFVEQRRVFLNTFLSQPHVKNVLSEGLFEGYGYSSDSLEVQRLSNHQVEKMLQELTDIFLEQGCFLNFNPDHCKKVFIQARSDEARPLGNQELLQRVFSGIDIRNISSRIFTINDENFLPDAYTYRDIVIFNEAQCQSQIAYINSLFEGYAWDTIKATGQIAAYDSTTYMRSVENDEMVNRIFYEYFPDTIEIDGQLCPNIDMAEFVGSGCAFIDDPRSLTGFVDRYLDRLDGQRRGIHYRTFEPPQEILTNKLFMNNIIGILNERSYLARFTPKNLIHSMDSLGIVSFQSDPKMKVHLRDEIVLSLEPADYRELQIITLFDIQYCVMEATFNSRGKK